MIIKKIFISLCVVALLCLMAACSLHKSKSAPTHEDTLWMEKIDTLRQKDDVKGIIKNLKAFLATPRQHNTRIDMRAIDILSWYLFCDKQQEEAMLFLLRGDSIAHATNDMIMQASFRYMNGRFIAVDKRELGRQYMQDGITMMKQCLEQDITKEDEKYCVVSILNYYGNLLSYMDNMPTSKKWPILKEFEDILTQYKDKGLLSAKQIDSESFSICMTKFYCYMEDGKREKAEEMYKLGQKYETANSNYGKSVLTDALMRLGHFKEAIGNLEQDRQEYLHSGDTLDLNENYCALIQSMAACYDSLKMKDKALEFHAEGQRLESAIAVHHVNQNLEHLGTKYEVQQRQYQLDEERLHTRVSIIIIIALGLCLAMAMAGYIYYGHVSRILKKKNKLLTENVLHQLDESKAQQTKHKAKESEPENKESRDNNINAADKASVDRFIKELTERKLFCNVNFDRDALLDELNIPRRPFPHQFEEATGKSIAQYVLNLRLEYAADMIRQKPEYTIESIALDSGFSGRSTFYRNFASQFGITPTEYKNQLLQNE